MESCLTVRKKLKWKMRQNNWTKWRIVSLNLMLNIDVVHDVHCAYNRTIEMKWKQDKVRDAFVWCMLFKLKPESKWIYEKWMRLSSECSISHLFFIPDLSEGMETGKKDDPEQKKRMRLTAEKMSMSSVIHVDGRSFVAL